MNLEECARRKENNFTLIRLSFAWAVLFGHAFPITAHGSDPISLLMLPYAWVGSIAVGGFFAISGYLVTGSFEQRGAMAFIASRALRLYPAAIIHCVVVVLVIGPIATNVPISQYFVANPWQYLKNASLWEWTYNLPHVFATNPLPGATNGSSWTLPVELRCYLLILALGFFGALDRKLRSNIVVFGALYLHTFHYSSLPLFGADPHVAEPLSYFLWGMVFWINRSSINLSWPSAAIAIAVIPIATKFGYFALAYPPCVTYIICMVAYRTPFIDVDEWIGDISYGVYIYAWPIQQAIFWPGQGAWTNTVIATSIVLVLSYFSWRFVERPALGLRKQLYRLNSKLAAPTPPAFSSGAN